MGLKRLLTQSIIWRGFYFFSVLLVNVFLSRYLQASGTGNLYFITVIFSFLQVALSLGGESGTTYFASGNLIERNKLISLTTTWSMVAGLIMAALVYAYFLFNGSAGSTAVTWYCTFGFLYVCGQSLTNYSVAIYYTRENYFLPNLLLALVNLLYIFLIPGKNDHAHPAQVQWIMCLYFATFFTGGLLVYFSYMLQYKKEGAFSFPDKLLFRKFLKYSLTALGANFVFFLVYKMDYIFVNYSHVCTKADLGNYIQVSKLGQMMLIVPQIIATVVFPKTATGIERLKINNAILVMARIFSQIFLVVLILIIFFGDWLFIKVFGESFNKMQLPMIIIIPGIFALSVSALLSAYFSGKGNVKVSLRSAVLAIIIMFAGDYFFVLPYGIIAAAIVSTLSYFTELGYLLFQFYKDYSVSWVEFIKWKKNDYDFLFTILKKNVADV